MLCGKPDALWNALWQMEDALHNYLHSSHWAGLHLKLTNTQSLPILPGVQYLWGEAVSLEIHLTSLLQAVKGRHLKMLTCCLPVWRSRPFPLHASPLALQIAIQLFWIIIMIFFPPTQTLFRHERDLDLIFIFPTLNIISEKKINVHFLKATQCNNNCCEVNRAFQKCLGFTPIVQTMLSSSLFGITLSGNNEIWSVKISVMD